MIWQNKEGLGEALAVVGNNEAGKSLLSPPPSLPRILFLHKAHNKLKDVQDGKYLGNPRKVTSTQEGHSDPEREQYDQLELRREALTPRAPYRVPQGWEPQPSCRSTPRDIATVAPHAEPAGKRLNAHSRQRNRVGW